MILIDIDAPKSNQNNFCLATDWTLIHSWYYGYIGWSREKRMLSFTMTLVYQSHVLQSFSMVSLHTYIYMHRIIREIEISQIIGKSYLKGSSSVHTSAEGHLGYKKCLQGSVNGFWALLMGYFENQLSPKYWLGAFWENQFSSIFLTWKNFIWH